MSNKETLGEELPSSTICVEEEGEVVEEQELVIVEDVAPVEPSCSTLYLIGFPPVSQSHQ